MKLHRLPQFIVAGLVAATIAVPVAQASNDRVQVAGSFVAPGQVSETQLRAGHAPVTGMAQIGGKLVAPEQISAYENSVGGASGSAGGDSSSGLGTSGITAAAILGSLVVLVGASALVARHRRRLAPAAS